MEGQKVHHYNVITAGKSWKQKSKHKNQGCFTFQSNKLIFCEICFRESAIRSKEGPWPNIRGGATPLIPIATAAPNFSRKYWIFLICKKIHAWLCYTCRYWSPDHQYHYKFMFLMEWLKVNEKCLKTRCKKLGAGLAFYSFSSIRWPNNKLYQWGNLYGPHYVQLHGTLSNL